MTEAEDHLWQCRNAYIEALVRVAGAGVKRGMSVVMDAEIEVEGLLRTHEDWMLTEAKLILGPS